MSDEKKGMQGRWDVPISGHEYDGIQEFDNPLPRWWRVLFYLTILHSAGYFTYYILGPGPTLVERFETDRRQAELARPAVAAGEGLPGEDAVLAAFNDPGKKDGGKAVFAGKCGSCHGPQGQGGIGPNLTDDHWIHGGKLPEILRVVAKGVGEKGMPPWEPVLSRDELVGVVAFVKSLRGTNPPNPKAPQGEMVKD